MDQFLVPLLVWISVAPGLQTPRAYDAPWTHGPVVIDGRLDDASWDLAPWTEDFVDILGVGEPIPSLRTRAKVLWDDQYLYVGAEMVEPHLWATLMDRDAIIYRDDDFEVFLDPDGDGLAYYEAEVNAYGTVLDLFLDKPYNTGGSATIEWDIPGLQVGVFLSGTLNDPSNRDEGWSVELAMPWKELVPPDSYEGGARLESSGAGAEEAARSTGRPPSPGEQWRVNFSRVDWPLEVSGSGYEKTAEASPENRHPESNWVWSPQGVINMHVPGLWGTVRFVKEPQRPLESTLQ
jgi:hypothetical protein